MSVKIKKIIPVNQETAIILHVDEDPAKGSFISIKQSPALRNTPGEVALHVNDIPALAKAIYDITLELTPNEEDGANYSSRDYN